ncbi:right-handed parallel beta-helix repeat-containing protein [bacterium]|nr:right-handed parallel beta-helix repeat-containing protein [bacterium]
MILSFKKATFKRQKAFTLPELLVIIFIIGILAVLIVMYFSHSKAKARDSRRISEINDLRKAVQMYYLEHGHYPTSTDSEDWCSLEITDSTDPHYCKYLRQELVPKYIKDLPQDPRALQTEGTKYYSYQYITTSSASQYKFHADLETMPPYEVYSIGGKAVVYNSPGSSPPPPSNNPPVANPDSATTCIETAIDIDVLANDSDPDDGGAEIDPSTVVVEQNPSHGTATPLATGEIRYIPAPGYLGQDQFTYTVKDIHGAQSNEAVVTVTVSCCCGMHITADTTLNCDITGCAGTIIYIDASDITLDCNGHYLQSTGDYGIKNNGHSNVTVKNCKIDMDGPDGDYGIYYIGANNSTIENNDVYVSDVFSIYVAGGSGITIANNILDAGTGDAIWLNNSSNATISGNTINESNLAINVHNVSNAIISNNTIEGGIGNPAIVCVTVSNSTISNNTLKGNIKLASGSNHNNIIANDIDGNGGAIYLKNNCTHNTISDNTARVTNMSGALHLQWGSNNNVISGNDLTSFEETIILQGVSGNEIFDNTVIATDKEAFLMWEPSTMNNKIYNNYIDSPNPVIDWVNAGSNEWNTNKQPGPNIIGGPWIGGNYWTNPSKTGYSDKCTDSDSDGFCDSPYDVEHNDSDCSDTNNCDKYPLTLTP